MKKKKIKYQKKVKKKEVVKNINPNHKELKKQKPLPDNIDEYFAKIEGSKEAFHSRELFKAEKDVDLKTDLGAEEINHINTLMFNNVLLKSRGLKPVFEGFITKYMRLRFSLDRKSRGEFVNINKNDNTEEAVRLASNLSNITGSKK